MSHPLYINDYKSTVNLSDFQIESINIMLSDIDNNILILKDNNCLCRNDNSKNDILLSEKDRYGIPVNNMICSKCGLIRSEKIFDEKSNILFYQKYYRNIYVGLNKPNNQFFEDQIKRGEAFISLIKKHINLNDIKNVLEIGCGSGGIIYPFNELNISCRGIDYNEEYLEYGRLKGLSLISGDYKNTIQDNSTDLLILSHVMEHFTNPIKEMVEVIKKINHDKYLLVEVPGIFFIKKIYFDPILYFQNAHVINYYHYYLTIFFKKLGLEVMYGDERCIFLLKKYKNWTAPTIDCIYDESMSNYPVIINKYIRNTCLQYKYYLNPYLWKYNFLKRIS